MSDARGRSSAKVSRGSNGSPGSRSPGGRSPEGRGRGGSPGRGRRGKTRSRSPKKGAKTKKKKGELPKDWSTNELRERTEKFARFYIIDKVANSSALEISNKKLLDEEMTVLTELFSRYTEIQSVTLKRCYLTDEVFVPILEIMRKLRHIKVLDLQFNLLGTPTVELLISTFAKADRRPESVDLRMNLLTEADGLKLYAAFNGFVNTLNAVPIRQARNKEGNTFAVANARLRLCEVVIISQLLRDSRSIYLNILDISGNEIRERGFQIIVELLTKCPNLITVVLARNPLCNAEAPTVVEPSYRSLEKLWRLCAVSKTITSIDLTDVKNIDVELRESIYRSCMVNRSVKSTLNPNFFGDYVAMRIKYGAPPPPRNPLAGYEVAFNEMDLLFARLNRTTERSVTIEGDEIRIHKVVQRRVSSLGI